MTSMPGAETVEKTLQSAKNRRYLFIFVLQIYKHDRKFGF